MQGLTGLLRQAKDLAATLTRDYQAYHDREMKELANALATEHRQVAADLNSSIETARTMISNQIMAGEAVFDAATSTIRISWGRGAFNDTQQDPYPEAGRKALPQ